MEAIENAGQDGVESQVGLGDGANGEAGAVANGAGEAVAAGGDELAPVNPVPARRGRQPKSVQSKSEAAGVATEQFPEAVLLDVDPRPMTSKISPELGTSPWHVFAELVQKIEASEPDRRLVRVWHPEPKVEVLNGVYAGAEVLIGDQAYQWSDGEICQINLENSPS